MLLLILPFMPYKINCYEKDDCDTRHKETLFVWISKQADSFSWYLVQTALKSKMHCPLHFTVIVINIYRNIRPLNPTPQGISKRHPQGDFIKMKDLKRCPLSGRVRQG